METDAFELGKEEDVREDIAAHSPALYNMIDTSHMGLFQFKYSLIKSK